MELSNLIKMCLLVVLFLLDGYWERDIGFKVILDIVVVIKKV